MNRFSVVILAGGLATRLRPLTETIPKSLVLVNNEPFIVHQLRLLRQNSIEKVVICIGYLGNKIVDLIGDGSKFGLKVQYSDDGQALLGTAGAIKKALPMLSENFFVLYGDSYLTCNYADVQKHFENQQKLGLMTVFKNNGQWDKSNIEFLQGKIIAYNKHQQTARMHYIDYGLGVFNKQAFVNIADERPHDLAELYQALLARQQLSAYEVSERFYEIGSFTGIAELGYYLASM